MYGPTWPFLLILIVYGPDVVVVNCWDRLCTLSKAPRTKETLPDFHEWCRVDGLSTDPRVWGVTIYVNKTYIVFILRLK